MRVLGIETTCDETAASVVSLSGRGGGEILSNEVMSQIAEHAAYGGVVPEIAARAHVDVLDRLVERALSRAGVKLADLDGVAAAAGPGLIGGVIVGVTMAKAIAAVHGKPFLAVNHLEGHALSARLSDDVQFPYLLLLVSGGHCQLLVVEAVGAYRRLGLRVNVSGPWPALVAVLAGIDEASLRMLVDDLQLQPAPSVTAGAAQPLGATFTVVAFQAGPAR